MANRDKVVAKVYETFDYNKFKFLDINREVKRSRVETIKAKMLKNFHLEPIKVTPQFGIIKGQHSYMAAKELGLPIRYIIEETLTVGDQLEIEDTVSDWTKPERIEMFIKDSNTNYIRYKEFITLFPTLKFGVVMSLLTNAPGRNRAAEVAFNEGQLEVQNFQKAKETAQKLLSVAPHFEDYNVRSFGMPFLKIAALPDFDINRLLRKLEKRSQLLRGKFRETEYLAALQEIYNWNEGKTNKLTFA